MLIDLDHAGAENDNRLADGMACLPLHFCERESKMMNSIATTMANHLPFFPDELKLCTQRVSIQCFLPLSDLSL